MRRSRPLDEPLPATFRWVASLPAEVRPLSLLRQFPRIVNGLARGPAEDCGRGAYVDELLTDRRGGRRGFPLAVHTELLTLREYFAGRYPVAR
jgi:hypothetical protein